MDRATTHAIPTHSHVYLARVALDPIAQGSGEPVLIVHIRDTDELELDADLGFFVQARVTVRLRDVDPAIRGKDQPDRHQAQRAAQAVADWLLEATNEWQEGHIGEPPLILATYGAPLDGRVFVGRVWRRDTGECLNDYLTSGGWAERYSPYLGGVNL